MNAVLRVGVLPCDLGVTVPVHSQASSRDPSRTVLARLDLHRPGPILTVIPQVIHVIPFDASEMGLLAELSPCAVLAGCERQFGLPDPLVRIWIEHEVVALVRRF